ncbi:hypothetical protein AB0E81_11340 [Streptomyces sp. NPDC033538]|uniref:hypothetical protein n=1 Tax=Streptomyces sp. NPDC033538 TaxID=3155367 RepID=UPI00340AA027
MVNDVPRTAAEYRAQERERKQKEALQKRAANFTANLILLPLLAYVLMLAIGAVHGFAPAVPALGYGTTLLIALGFDALAVVTKKFRK